MFQELYKVGIVISESQTCILGMLAADSAQMLGSECAGWVGLQRRYHGRDARSTGPNAKDSTAKEEPVV